MQHPLINQVLSFWFGTPKSAEYGKPKPVWFTSTPEIDQNLRIQFEKTYEQAKAGEFDDLKNTPEGALVLILIFDQFPRNMYRFTAKAFDTDIKAREISKFSISLGFDQQLPPFMRTFIYMPLEHSENIEDQNQSVALFEKLGDANNLKYAIDHQNVIKQFRRFPSRNQSLGRISTDAEIDFLKKISL